MTKLFVTYHVVIFSSPPFPPILPPPLLSPPCRGFTPKLAKFYNNLKQVRAGEKGAGVGQSLPPGMAGSQR